MPRNERDFYPTPWKAFKPMLKYFPLNKSIWEPCQGDGRLVRWLRESGRKADGTDLSEGSDYLLDRTYRQVIITNPPFSLTGEFIVHALKHACEIYFLLPLNSLSGQSRYKEIYSKRPLVALFPLVERPSFTQDGGTDRVEYGWFYWGGSLLKQITHLKYEP